MKPYTTSEKETSAVSSSVVGQTDFDTVAWELMGVGSADNNVSFNTGVRDLENILNH